MTTNFDLAPPSKTVDGLAAVPLDIQQLTAVMTFDAATASCAVDATMAFEVAPAGGCPIFDLRQTIGAAWLDGAPLAASLLQHHDFGGGTDARLRVLARSLAGGTTHTLRLTYALGQPDALGTSSGPPTYSWNGPRLTLKFWYTDLRAGRYLDAWLPANLQFDQFPVALELAVLHTAVAHAVVTNGAVTDLGANHWRVEFPPHWTALSGCLNIHPADELASRVDTVALPGGAALAIHSCKLATSTVDLAAEAAQLGTWLADNVHQIGSYAHGGRFVAFHDGSGGMEYCGACRSGAGAMRHEAYHSWWGRAVQPASQNDGWYDEAWTAYQTDGASPAPPVPFNFAAAPVELCTRNPWVRQTSGLGYTSGKAVFQGLAAAMGSAALAGAMRAYYAEHRPRPTTTLELEGHLLAASGRTQVVDGFHRFVYGLADPSPATGLWLRDDPAHAGSEAWSGRFWDSPDLWVRHADDGGTAHQDPRTGHDNWIYARVRNLGPSVARHYMVVFNVRLFAGTEFVYPDDFLPGIAATGGFELGAGDARVVRARWPAALVPPQGAHACLVAVALGRQDQPATDRHVWEQNNLAQKNLTIVALEPDGWVVLPIAVGSRLPRPWLGLELRRPPAFPRMPATLLAPAATRPIAPAATPRTDSADCSAGERAPLPAMVPWTHAAPDAWARHYFEGAHEHAFAAGAAPSLRVAGSFPASYGLRLQVPHDARPGSSLTVDLVQRDPRGQVVGGIAVRIDVRR